MKKHFVFGFGGLHSPNMFEEGALQPKTLGAIQPKTFNPVGLSSPQPFGLSSPKPLGLSSPKPLTLWGYPAHNPLGYPKPWPKTLGAIQPTTLGAIPRLSKTQAIFSPLILLSIQRVSSPSKLSLRQSTCPSQTSSSSPLPSS